MAATEPLSIREQAELVDEIVSRCVLHGGDLSAETVCVFSKAEAEQLHQLAMRLHRIAPFEDRIRRLVMGK